MTVEVWRLASLGLLTVLLLALGAAVGCWQAERHYRPLLDTINTDLANAKLARDNLETLASEQGRKLVELVAAGAERERKVAQVVADAQDLAKSDFAAANRLLQEKIGGDPAQTVAAIIEQGFGL